MTHKDRMLAGKIYDPADGEIAAEQLDCLELLYDYNATRPHERAKRDELLSRMFGKIGSGCYLEPPFYANWGGKNVYMGNNVYANFGLTLVDDGKIFIGDGVMFAPHVTVATAAHPVEPSLRKIGYQFNRGVFIGNNVWIGSGAVILPGVKIGDNSVIGAGSVVTKDIPENVVAVGNPARILRVIGERDREFYYKNSPIDWEELIEIISSEEKN